MREEKRAFSIDLTKPTAITYVNGIIAETPRAWAWMWLNLPKVRKIGKAADGCLQMKAAIISPRQMVLISYWRDQAALRGFYTHPAHVQLMRTLFRNQHWFTLYNETYEIPITTRYWNAPHGYALSQPWLARTTREFCSEHDLAPELADELRLGRDQGATH